MPRGPARAIEALTISNWSELIDAVYADSWDASIERFRSPWVFRGVCDARADLSTSLMRLAAGYEDLAGWRVISCGISGNMRIWMPPSAAPSGTGWR